MKTKLKFVFCALLLIAVFQQALHAQSWSLKGNAGTNPSANFLGTTDNRGLILRTNNTERMRITNIGNVGIGTSSPLQKLDVNGNINIANGSALYIGNERLIHTTGGNFFAGKFAGNASTSGPSNMACGNFALYQNTTGYNNTACGFVVLYSNITGVYNTASGVSALYSNINGSYNTASGVGALTGNTSGSNNTAIGYTALAYNTTGYFNTASGYFALYSNTSGNNNTALGYSADVNAGDLSNSTAIGNSALITASNQVRIGNSSVTSIGGYANWSNISDGRYKKNLKENVPGLEFIKALKPVTYNLDINRLETELRKNVPARDKDGKLLRQQTDADSKAIIEKEKMVHSGFVAQDVEKVSKQMGYDFSGVDAPKNDKDFYSLRYADFVVPLVKAVQELSKLNDEKDAKIDALEKQNNELAKRIERLEAMMTSRRSNITSSETSKIMSISNASLEQNIPNPFTKTTKINYTLPSKFNTAKIVITDYSGKVLKEIGVSSAGKGVVNLEGETLSSGTYNYSLIVDGRLANSKKMVITK